ncbi:MAG: DNA polymerase III subunit delta [Bacillota bacterium]
MKREAKSSEDAEGRILPVYLLVGEESYLRRRFVSLLRERLGIEKDSLNFSRFRGREATADAVLSACNMMTFDRRRRLVVAVEPPAMTSGSGTGEEDQWISYIRDPSDISCLCVAVDTIDRRRRLYRAFNDADSARVVPCEKPRGRKLHSWIRGRLSAGGKQVAPDAARMLAERDVSLDYLDTELQKLATYIGDREEVTADDVAAVTSAVREQDIFALVDAIGIKDPRRAVDQLQAMLSGGADPLMLLAMIARQVRLIWHVKYELGQGKSEGQAASTLGQPPFVVKKCAEQGRNFSPDQLERAMELVLTTDFGIKRGKWRPEMAVQRLVTVLCNPRLNLLRQ